MRITLAEAVEYLTQTEAGRTCGTCGSMRFTIIPYPVTFVLEGTEKRILTGNHGQPRVEGLPAIPVVCQGCGAISFRSVGTIAKIKTEDTEELSQ